IDERDVHATDIIARLQAKLADLVGLTVYMQPVQDITVDDRVSRTQFQYTLEDPNATELREWAPKMLAELETLSELRDVASDQQALGLRKELVVNRETASRLGITPAVVDQTLYDAYGQRQVSTIFTQLNQYHVVLEVAPEFRDDPIDLQSLFIRPAASGTGPAAASAASETGAVPLSAFARTESTTAPTAINHQGQFPVVNLSFNLAPGASLGAAVEAVNRVKDSLGMPASIQGAFQGSAAAFERSLANEPLLILAAVVTVYIVLGVLYES